jgi:hypothetical protein
MADDFAPEQVVQITDATIVEEGFTESGVRKYRDTVQDYALTLLRRAIKHGEIDKATGMVREVTHDHVRQAASAIAGRGELGEQSGWAIAGQVLEYVFIAFAGAGASHLDNPIGTATFGVSLTAAVILIVIRLIRKRH